MEEEEEEEEFILFWNTRPVHLKNRNLTLTTFMRHLKSYLFSVLISYRARLGCDHINALYKFTITYLLTYGALEQLVPVM